MYEDVHYLIKLDKDQIKLKEYQISCYSYFDQAIKFYFEP